MFYLIFLKKEERARRKAVVERIMSEIIKPLFEKELGEELSEIKESRIKEGLHSAVGGALLMTSKEKDDAYQRSKEFDKKHPEVYIPRLIACFRDCQKREEESLEEAYNHVYGKPRCSQCQEWMRKAKEPKLDYYLYPGHGYE